MAEHLTLTISGFDGEPVPNQFLRQPGEADGLAILLPGLGYTCDMPVFYYSELQFLLGGYDVLRVDYDYRSRESRTGGPGELAERLHADVLASVRAGTSQRDYPRIAVVGKSLGTLAMARLVGSDALPNDWASVWLTPLLKEDAVFDALMEIAGPAVVVIGSDDHHYGNSRLESLASRDNVTVIVQESGNHSLNAGNSAGESVHSLASIIDQLDAFYGFENSNRDERD